MCTSTTITNGLMKLQQIFDLFKFKYLKYNYCKILLINPFQPNWVLGYFLIHII